MLMNLELIARFGAQARTDHIQRIGALLTDIDLDQVYSKQPGFLSRLTADSVRLHEAGVNGAYPQACILYAVLRLELPLDTFLENRDAHGLHANCLHKCLEFGVVPGVFQYLHRHLAGIAQADRAWVEAQLEPDGLLIAADTLHSPSAMSLLCDHEGPSAQNSEFTSNARANFFQTEAGFRHTIQGSFTAQALLREVCRRAWPSDASVVSLDPKPLRCQLGVGDANKMDVLQTIDLLDARQFKLDFSQLAFKGEPAFYQRLKADLQQVGMLIDCSVNGPATLIQGDLVCQAGWQYPDDQAVFRIQGQASFRLLEQALSWEANLHHHDLQVGLSVLSKAAQQVQWLFDEQYPLGQLKVGEPLLIRQYAVPLVNVVSASVSPGKPVIGQSTGHAGDLTLVLQACVNPQSRRLEFQLILKHSAINCHWQSFDPLRGPMHGCWPLLPETTICTWSLSHG